jgi:hypothetical protein
MVPFPLLVKPLTILFLQASHLRVILISFFLRLTDLLRYRIHLLVITVQIRLIVVLGVFPARCQVGLLFCVGFEVVVEGLF